MFEFQSFPIVAFVFEIEIITLNGVVDQEKTQWLERHFALDPVQGVHPPLYSKVSDEHRFSSSTPATDAR